MTTRTVVINFRDRMSYLLKNTVIKWEARTFCFAVSGTFQNNFISKRLRDNTRYFNIVQSVWRDEFYFSDTGTRTWPVETSCIGMNVNKVWPACIWMIRRQMTWLAVHTDRPATSSCIDKYPPPHWRTQRPHYSLSEKKAPTFNPEQEK